MKNWTLEDASHHFADVAQRALAHHPQRVELGGADAVVVIHAADYATLTFARDLVDFIRRSSVPGVAREPEVERSSHEALREPSRTDES